MKVLAFPRDDRNPYQRLLYGEMQRLGTQVIYLGCLTPSRTLNLLLLPFEVAARRVTGARLAHVHWVFGFGLPGADRLPWLRRVAQIWFMIWLWLTRLVGVHVVWTAHNVLPHAPVFADDIAARRALVAASDLVLVHSEAALQELTALGAAPRKSALIPHGLLAPAGAAAALRVPGRGSGTRHLLYFGTIHAYKGVEDLLAAFSAVPGDVPIRLTVAGRCDDPGTRLRLEELAGSCGDRVALRLEHVPDRVLPELFGSADAVVLPYRTITTSGCAMLALAYGRPLVVPDLAAFSHLPAAAIITYGKVRQPLTSALVQVASTDSATLAAMSAAARAYAASLSWPGIASQTEREMAALLAPGRRAARPDQPVAVREASRR